MISKETLHILVLKSLSKNFEDFLENHTLLVREKIDTILSLPPEKLQRVIKKVKEIFTVIVDSKSNNDLISEETIEEMLEEEGA